MVPQGSAQVPDTWSWEDVLEVWGLEKWLGACLDGGGLAPPT